MLPPEIVTRLRNEYGLAVGDCVIVPDGSNGRLYNVRFDPDIAVVQFLQEDGNYRIERFSLAHVLPLPPLPKTRSQSQPRRSP